MNETRRIRMKLTKQKLDQIIRDVLNEHRGVPMKDRGIKGQQIARKRDDENAMRTRAEKERKEKVFPGMRELRSLSRGVIAENEMVDDEDGYIKIKKDAFHRLLTEQNEQLRAKCSQMGMKSMKEWLNITNAFADAGKGKFGEEK